MFKKKWFIYYEYLDEDSTLKEVSSPFFQTKREALKYLNELAQVKTVTKSILLIQNKNGEVKIKSEKNYFFFYLFCGGVFLSLVIKVVM